MAIPRFQISDLLARYSLEPSLRDVFVEGRFDKDVLATCVRKRGASDVVVYEIDCVDVPSELLKSLGLTSGNRQRVISLARELAGGTKSEAYRCIADKDLDHWLGALVNFRGLCWTDHCSIELYFLEEDLVRDILLYSAKADLPDWPRFYSSFLSVLQHLYALRLALRQLNLSPHWPSFDRCLSTSGSTVSFDLADYANRLLMSIGRSARISEVLACVSFPVKATVQN